MNEPIETYTFSRALHLMRYGGKKMKPKYWNDGSYCYTINETLMLHRADSFPTHGFNLSGYEIMGEWVEVK